MRKLVALLVLTLHSFSSVYAADLPRNLDKRLLGTWMGFPHIITFKKGGVAIAGLGNGYGRGTWRLQDDTILVTMPKSGLHQFRIVSYNSANNSMTGEYKGRQYPVIRM
jgi:hypothetical protein